MYFQREAKCSEQQVVNLYVKYSFSFFPPETLSLCSLCTGIMLLQLLLFTQLQCDLFSKL